MRGCITRLRIGKGLLLKKYTNEKTLICDMKKVIIIGTTCFSEVIFDAIVTEEQAEVVGFSVEREFYEEDSFLGFPVVPFEELPAYFNMNECFVLVSIGYNSMNKVRERIFKLCEAKKYKMFTFVSKRAFVEKSALIGEGCVVLPFVSIGSNVSVGKGCIFFYNAHITHHIKIGDFCFISTGANIGGCTAIGNNCFIGMGSAIANNLTVESQSFIGANALITHDTEFNSAYVTTETKKLDRWGADFIVKLLK